MSEDRDLLREALSPGPQCPSSDQLGRYGDALLEGSERSALEAHIQRCVHCRSELALLQQFVNVSVRPEEARSVAWIESQLKSRAQQIYSSSAGKRPREVSWWKALFTPPVLGRTAVVMGCLLVAIGASLYVRRGFAPALHPVPDAATEVTRSNAVPLVSPKGDLDAKPESLQWQAVPGAVRYRASVMEVDRTELWQAETAEVAIALPPSMRARIQPAKSLLWRVVALDASGSQVGSSDLEKFRLSPDIPAKTR